jgi:histidinol-phosphate aminotransferase
MPLTRRTFVKSLGVGGVGAFSLPLIAARGHEAYVGAVANGAVVPEFDADHAARLRAGAPRALRLDSNENPNGPGESALSAIRAMFGEAPRYPDMPSADLRDAIARRHGVKAENVILGCGSGEVLRMATYAFTSPTRALVTGAPTFEDPGKHAEVIGTPVRAVPVTGTLHLDLGGMARACGSGQGAGLVFLCNPNNPTATLHGAPAIRDFVNTVTTKSPETTVLIDEAYFEYVEDPAYATAIPLALENPRVVVARTFSKIYGMAGLRLGYAIGHTETIKSLQRQKLSNSVNVLAAAAGLATLGDEAHIARERNANRSARDFTQRFFESLGYKVTPPQTNFLMVDVRRDAKEFQDACRKRDVLVGRPFPPLKTQARVSIGTMEEMQRAVEVFRQVLSTA